MHELVFLRAAASGRQPWSLYPFAPHHSFAVFAPYHMAPACSAGGSHFRSACRDLATHHLQHVDDATPVPIWRLPLVRQDGRLLPHSHQGSGDACVRGTDTASDAVARAIAHCVATAARVAQALVAARQHAYHAPTRGVQRPVAVLRAGLRHHRGPRPAFLYRARTRNVDRRCWQADVRSPEAQVADADTSDDVTAAHDARCAELRRSVPAAARRERTRTDPRDARSHVDAHVLCNLNPSCSRCHRVCLRLPSPPDIWLGRQRPKRCPKPEASRRQSHRCMTHVTLTSVMN